RQDYQPVGRGPGRIRSVRPAILQHLASGSGEHGSAAAPVPASVLAQYRKRRIQRATFVRKQMWSLRRLYLRRLSIVIAGATIKRGELDWRSHVDIGGAGVLLSRPPWPLPLHRYLLFFVVGSRRPGL